MDGQMQNLNHILRLLPHCLFYAKSHVTCVCVRDIKLRLLPIERTLQITISIESKEKQTDELAYAG